MQTVIYGLAVLAVMGAAFGAMLGVAAKVFAVQKDPKEEAILECLPGANCGGCGYPGCSGYAAAVVSGKAPVNACAVGEGPVAAQIAQIMGVEAGSSTPKKAVVACSGTCDKTGKKYEFQGIQSCQAVKGFYGGDGACKFGCLGYGDCTRACAFDAIHIVDGIAKVDRDKCTGCGACAAACPNAIISIIPEPVKNPNRPRPVVLCQNKDKGADTRKACTAGCIGCMKCAKACKLEAITVENFLAKIDQEKCVGCYMCVKECPMGVIHVPANE